MRFRGDNALRRGIAGVALAAAGLTATAVTTAVVVTGTAERAVGAPTKGYWLVGIDGGIFTFGAASFFGSTGNIPLNQPIVGMAPTRSAQGYWMVASDGGIFAFGDAGFFGSMGGTPLNKPVVSMAPSPTGKGYWMVASDGGIFAFGDAVFYGSAAAEKPVKPVVDIAPTPSGRGYWLATSNGAVYPYGDAAYYGAVDGALEKRIHAMAASPTGSGYWLLGGDGKVFTFGDAGEFGVATDQTDKRTIDIAPSGTGQGYYVTTSAGQVLTFGDAPSYGGADDLKLNSRITSIVPVNGGQGPVGNADAAEIDEDTDGTIDVLGNDQSPGGGALRIAGVGVPAHGTAALAGGLVKYTPAPDYHGPDTLDYTVTDGQGGTATASVALTVRSVDDKPKLGGDTLSIPENSPVSMPVAVLANDAGLGDGLASVSIDKGPGHGTATAEPDGTVSYQPKADYEGNDSFRYKVTDVDGDSATAEVAVTVPAGNDTPVAVDDGPYQVDGGTAFYTMKVLVNDDGGDGRPLIRVIDPATGGPTDTAVATATGEFKRAGSGIDYSPAAGFNGPTEIQYLIVDDDGKGDPSNPATARINVRNGPPRAVGQNITIEQGKTATGTLSARDPEGDPLSFRVFEGSGPAPVQMVLNERTGDFSFGPINEPGKYSFKFIARDGARDSNTAMVTVDARGAASQPASSDSGSSDSGSSGGAEPAPSTTTATTGKPTTTTTAKATTTTTGKSSRASSSGGSSSGGSGSKGNWLLLPLVARRRRS